MKSTLIVLLFCIFCHTIVNGHGNHYYSSDSQFEDSYEKHFNSKNHRFSMELLKKKHLSTPKHKLHGQDDNEETNEETNEERNEEKKRLNENDEQDNEDSKQETEEIVQENELTEQLKQNEGSDEKEQLKDVEKDEENYDDVVEEEYRKPSKASNQYKYELKNGDMADLFATNQHKYVPLVYNEFGNKFRRFVPRYHYSRKSPSHVDTQAEAHLDQAVKSSLKDADVTNYLVPREAEPELVLSIAKKAALEAASKPYYPEDDVKQKDILRSGDYWNGVWKEDITNPKKMLRTNKKKSGRYEQLLPELQTVKVKIMPGSKLHDLVSLTKEISPRLLYIVNNK